MNIAQREHVSIDRQQYDQAVATLMTNFITAHLQNPRCDITDHNTAPMIVDHCHALARAAVERMLEIGNGLHDHEAH